MPNSNPKLILRPMVQLTEVLDRENREKRGEKTAYEFSKTEGHGSSFAHKSGF